MQELFEKLRAAREARKLSLDDISAVTRIRRHVLQDLEEGNTSGVPATYLRAFIRSYATQVGLDAGELLREYDSRLREKAERPQPPEENSVPAQRKAPTDGISSRVSVPLLVTGTLIIAFIVSLSFLYQADKQKEVTEVPFSEVIKQREGPADRSTQQKDSLGALPEAFQNTRRESTESTPRPPMVLRAMTFDTVWIRILIDGSIQKEYTAPPRWSAQWKANDRFVISVGNASAVSFTLNNTFLNLPVKHGKPLRNFLIQRPASEPGVAEERQ